MTFDDLIWTLPLFEDLFLSMQGQNIMLVDGYLRELEGDLLRELVEIERTPPTTLFVSALSQMWIFAVYELLRTWRQRVRDLKREAQKMPSSNAGKSRLSGIYYDKQIAKARADPNYGVELDQAFSLIEPFFRQVEALRMNLAKHEVPKMQGIPALAPGYGRIDYKSGSISWQIDLGDNAVMIISRRELADDLISLVITPNAERDCDD